MSKLAFDGGTILCIPPESLSADLSDERRIVTLPESLSPSELALRSNPAMVQSLLRQAYRVRIDSEGNGRALVRHTKLRGLLCPTSLSALMRIKNAMKWI